MNNKIYIVSDFFADEYIGGAELTTSSLLSYCEEEVIEVKSRQITLDMLNNNKMSKWIFTNFSLLDPDLISVIPEILNDYHIIEYDYKFCKYRLPQHLGHENGCNCETLPVGNLIYKFYSGAKSLNWMSEEQMNYYHFKFPKLKDTYNFILSSVFSKEDLKTIIELKQTAQTVKKNTEMLLLGSNSWVKGFDQSREYCEERDISTKVVWGLPYLDSLKMLASHRGIVYLPNGFDTCPRWVIEAKLLGCKIIDNHYVQHRNESWFKKDENNIVNYLSNQPLLFWKKVLRNN